MSGQQPEGTPDGVVPTVTYLLTGEQTQRRFPDLFDEDDGDVYFDAGDATGNQRWADYVPDLVFVVATTDGRVVLASNASEWHMTACGFTLPGESGG